MKLVFGLNNVELNVESKLHTTDLGPSNIFVLYVLVSHRQDFASYQELPIYNYNFQQQLRSCRWIHHSSYQSSFNHCDQILPSGYYFPGWHSSTLLNWPFSRSPLTVSWSGPHMWRGLSQSLCPSPPGKKSNRHAQESLLSLIKKAKHDGDEVFPEDGWIRMKSKCSGVSPKQRWMMKIFSNRIPCGLINCK